MSTLENIKSSAKRTNESENLYGSRATRAFRERLDQLTASGEVTQTDVAKHLGLVQHYVSMMKLGKTKISLPKAPSIARLLGLDETSFTLMVIEQHFPEISGVMNDVFESENTFTKQEVSIIHALRNRCIIAALSDAQYDELAVLISKMHSGENVTQQAEDIKSYYENLNKIIKTGFDIEKVVSASPVKLKAIKRLLNKKGKIDTSEDRALEKLLSFGITPDLINSASSVKLKNILKSLL